MIGSCGSDIILQGGQLTLCCCSSGPCSGSSNCPGKNTKFTITIWNVNCAKDDTFKVLLDGAQIGTISNTTNTCTGGIFSTDTNITSANVPGFSCNCSPNLQGTSGISAPSAGTHTLRIESIDDQNNGNFGRVLVQDICESGGVYTLGKTFVDSTYAHAEGPPNFSEFTFSYP